MVESRINNMEGKVSQDEMETLMFPKGILMMQ